MNAAVATIPSHRDDIAAVSTLMVKVIDILKSKKGVMTTAAVFAKFTSLGLLATEKQGIEFREALQAVAHCDNSVWTLKKEFWK